MDYCTCIAFYSAVDYSKVRPTRLYSHCLVGCKTHHIHHRRGEVQCLEITAEMRATHFSSTHEPKDRRKITPQRNGGANVHVMTGSAQRLRHCKPLSAAKREVSGRKSVTCSSSEARRCYHPLTLGGETGDASASGVALVGANPDRVYP